MDTDSRCEEVLERNLPLQISKPAPQQISAKEAAPHGAAPMRIKNRPKTAAGPEVEPPTIGVSNWNSDHLTN